ncbi:MAG: DNA-directed RNA polymerase subunit omega [Deltaproteobacteria bacterium]|nr:DNA-directed RNA polymerase subunit omega [Deltaproteobacteria bacterium]
MARITVEDCLAKEPNRFALVLLAAKRTKQLLSGAKTLLPHVKNKPVVVALREVASGGVRFMTDEDMQKLKEREKVEREARLAQQASGDVEDRAKAQAILSADDLFISSPKAAVKDDDDDDELDSDLDEDPEDEEESLEE